MATAALPDDAVGVIDKRSDILDSARVGDCMRAGIFTCDLVPATAATVSRIETLREAAQRMAERGAAHVIVIDEASGHPVGVLSTTDILQAYAASHGSDG